MQKFTPKQDEAIDSRQSTLVSAAAGSGKTSVLTERVVKILTDCVNKTLANRMLIVTFTNDAALEMKTRINLSLLNYINEHKPTLDANDYVHLLKQYHLLDSANISTIDSFCINIVRENFERFNINPSFTPSSGKELSGECDAVLSEIIATAQNTPEELEPKGKYNAADFGKLCELLDMESDDRNLKKAVETVYDKSQYVPFPNDWYDSLIENYKIPFGDGHKWFNDAFCSAKRYVEDMNRLLGELNTYFDELYDPSSNGSEEFNHYNNAVNVITDNFNSRNWNGLALFLADYGPHKTGFRDKNKESLALFRGCRDKIDKDIEPLKKYFSVSFEETKLYLSEYRKAAEMFIDIVKSYSKSVIDVFKENNILSFSQIEQMTVELICKKDENGNFVPTDTVGKEYIDRYSYVMVDEYQDVNDLQEVLFNVLSDNQKNLFVVGDIKQSIYRFRGSNPDNFLNKKRLYDTDNSKKSITLSENFRSRKSVCDFVDFAFSNLMTKETCGIDYQNGEQLNYAATKYFNPENDTPTDMVFVDKNESDDDKASSKAIANYIAKLVNDKFQVSKKEEGNPKATRDVTFKDICVLFSSTAAVPDLVEELKKRNIPAIYEIKDFTENFEISLVMSLLSVVDNPQSDVDLLNLLLSPLYNFSADDIVMLRKSKHDGSLYSAVLSGAENGNKKCCDFVKSISELRSRAALMNIAKFLMYAIYETDIFSIVSSLPDSKQRRKNLYLLMNMAQNSSGDTLSRFVDFVNNLSDNSVSSNDESTDAVRIKTMHKSKGLQFPVTIIGNLASQVNTDEIYNKKMIFSKKYGLIFKSYNENASNYVEHIGIKLSYEEWIREEAKEKLRLLYVALTRAEEKLAIFVNFTSKFSAKTLYGNVSYDKLDLTDLPKSLTVGSYIASACFLHPDADALRDMVDNCDVLTMPTESKLNIISYDESEDFTVQNSNDGENNEANEEFAQIIRQNILLSNENNLTCESPLKTSVSAIAHKDTDEQYFFNDRPAFLSHDGVTATDKGTATHKVMQFITIQKNIDIDSEFERLYENKFISLKEYEVADRDKIRNFFNSDLFERIAKSNKVLREKRFMFKYNPQTASEKLKTALDSPTVIQGAIDLLFFEDDGIVVVDFKTDKINDVKELAERYDLQLELYEMACSSMFGEKVKEKIIYSFNKCEEISL